MGEEGRTSRHHTAQTGAGTQPIGGGGEKDVILLSRGSEHTNRLLQWAFLPRGLFFSLTLSVLQVFVLFLRLTLQDPDVPMQTPSLVRGFWRLFY